MSRNIFQQLYYKDLESAYSNFKGVIFDNVIDEVPDLQNYFTSINKQLTNNTSILVSYHNPLWEPILILASHLGIRRKKSIQNWIDSDDLKNILELSGYNNIVTHIRFLGITLITKATKKTSTARPLKDVGVSIIIPVKNEAGNIPLIIPSLPRIGKFLEIIFVEGGSSDNSWIKILDQLKMNNNFLKIKALKQKGVGKADATWTGLKAAKGSLLMIYDADRTVEAKDLEKFYNALILNPNSFANGNRLLYPMEQDAMQFLNKIGNMIFSRLFTTILGQRFKDTLCGTKAFYAKDFKNFIRSKTDPFGDFDLIFGAIRNGLTVIDIPVRYKSRVYGSTNINRFYHGMLLIKMTIIAFIEFKVLRQ